MKFASLLSFWIAHNESIIQWMLAIIVGFSAFLVFRSVFGKKEGYSGLGTSTASGDIQDLLKKVLDQTSILEKAMMSAPSAMLASMVGGTSNGLSPTGVVAPAAGGVDPIELAKLKKLILDRDEELERLKNDPIANKLRDQINKVQELQNRLKEYEILEDDIADLSLYKEENARLKTELQNLVGSGAAPGATPGASDALVDQFAQVVDQTKGIETSPAAEGAAHLPQTGDPMADFASTVKIEKSVAAQSPPSTELPPATPVPPVAVPVPVAAPTPPPLAAVPTPAKPAAVESEAANDLFAEFSTGSLDTDKVMEELVSLEKLPAADGKEALEGALDADKMVAEAAGFSKN